MQLDALTAPDTLGDVPLDVEELRRLELAVHIRIEQPDAISAFRGIEVGGRGVVHAAPRFFAR
jgi:hypothetical protein